MTSLAKTQPAALDRYGGYSREQIDLVKRTVAHDCTDDELALFLTVSANKGLDPFSGEIFAIKRNVKGRNGWESRMTIQTGIDGFRKVAERTGQRDGMDPPQWCGPDGKWVDVWLSQDPPRAARVSVYRKGHSRPYTATALWDFYVQTTKEGKPTHMWAKGGPHMLAKCAEALALREAFPAELSGLYAREEMQQASNGGASAGSVAEAVEHEAEALPEEVAAMEEQARACTSEADIRAFCEMHGWNMSRMDGAHASRVFRALKEGKPSSLTVATIKAWLHEAAFGQQLDLNELDQIGSQLELSTWTGKNVAAIDALEGEERDTALSALYDTAARVGVDDAQMDAWLDRLRGNGA